MQSFYTFKAEPSIEILVKTGTPTNQISGIAKEIKADLIIMGTKSIHNAFQKIFGSITSATTNHAHCPVLVVPEETKSFKISQLVYTTNLRKIDLFQIWELGKQMRPFSPIFRIVHIAKKAEENTALKMEELESFFEEHPPSLQITYHNFINKNVSKELSEIAHDWEADRLVMYKPHRNFLEEAFHISLTKMATFHFKVPILVIK